jgi:pilus assembly protein Flp/PilA
MIKQFILDEEGQSLVEYAMLISLMALVVVSAIIIFRSGINNTYNNIDNKMVLNTSTG